MGEDNTREALNALIYALRETRAGGNVTFVDLSEGENRAYIYFEDGTSKNIAVSGDSGLAAIIDVCEALM